MTDIRFTQEIKEKGLQAYDGDVQLIMPTEESTLYNGNFWRNVSPGTVL